MLNKRILVLIFLLVFLTLVGCFPQNHAPIITSSPVTAMTVGETYVYDVEATDPDGDTLTYSLTVKPTGMAIDPATGLIKWTPTAKGNYAVVVKVSDEALDITQSFTIVVSDAPPPVNHAPIITSIPNLTSLVGIQYTYTIEATDPDGDTLTYSLTTKPSGMAINPANGFIWWVPTSAQVGSRSVTVKVSDGVLFDTQSFIIKVSEPSVPPTNQAPIIISTPVTTATVGVTYFYNVNATDPDGDTLTYSLITYPTGMTIKSGTG
ncbi:hypothetical protein ES708_25699 [subsurface metagenome]